MQLSWARVSSSIGNTAGRAAEADVEAIFHVFVLAGLREKFRDGLLVLFQDADAEALLFVEEREHQCAVVHAD